MSKSLWIRALGFSLASLFAVSAWGKVPKGKKVLILPEMEGVSGIFDIRLQCVPYKSPGWQESRKLLTGEVNAAADALFDGAIPKSVSGTVMTGDIHSRCSISIGECNCLQGRRFYRRCQSTLSSVR